MPRKLKDSTGDSYIIFDNSFNSKKIKYIQIPILLIQIRNIVEHALFGTDPDVAEDLSDPKTSTESISRQRQRNEICMALKRSSVIYRYLMTNAQSSKKPTISSFRVYLFKNLLEVLLAFSFLALNVCFGMDPNFQGVETCRY